MKTDKILDYDDIGEALREGRALHRASGYRIQYAEGDLNFRPLVVSDPVPVGRQILASAGADPRDGYALFAILPSGDFEDVRLDETFDLRGRGAERFVAFRTDRTFTFTLNDRQLAWGTPSLPAAVLYQLAELGEDEGVFLDARGGTDRLIAPDEKIDLAEGCIERFVTARKEPTQFEIIVNTRPKTVTGSLVTFEQIVQLAFPGAHDPNVEFTMTYRHAAQTPPTGELGSGGTVRVKNGTIFNVKRTVQS